MSELKPCPFCNSKAHIARNGDSFWIECNDCEACGAAMPTEPSAIRQWNTRSPSEERLREAVRLFENLISMFDDRTLVRNTEHDDRFETFTQQGIRITNFVGRIRQFLQSQKGEGDD